MNQYYLGLLLKYQFQVKFKAIWPITELSFDVVEFPKVRRVFATLVPNELVYVK